MQEVIALIISVGFLAVFYVFSAKAKKRADEERRELKEWRDAVRNDLTAIRYRLVK